MGSHSILDGARFHHAMFACSPCTHLHIHHACIPNIYPRYMETYDLRVQECHMLFPGKRCNRSRVIALQGDCGSSDVAAHLSLSAEEQADFLPLKPRQCLIIVPDTFIMIYSGRFVMQNMYLKMQSTSPISGAVFVKALSLDRWTDDPHKQPPTLFLVNTTFHGTRRGNAYGVYLAHKYSRLYLRGVHPS